MALYLSLDGVDDYIQAPSMMFDEIIIDIASHPRSGNAQYILDARDWANMMTRVMTSSSSDEFYDSTVYFNDFLATNYTNFIPNGERGILRVVNNDTGTTDATIGTQRGAGDSTRFAKLDLYNAKFMLNGSIVAHYDMSTGTVDDQSGNGNHATLYGGTWLDDGTGGGTEPVGEDGSTAFDLKQSIYTDSTTQADTRQTIYSDGYTAYDLKQMLYANLLTSFDARQVIYEDNGNPYGITIGIYDDSTYLFDTKQQIYSDYNFNIDTNQILFQDSNVSFNMLQEYFSDGMIGSAPFDLRIILFDDGAKEFDSKQLYFEENADLFNLSQSIYENGKLESDTKFIIYNDDSSYFNLNQSLFSENSDQFNTTQQMFENNLTNFNVENHFYEESFLNFNMEQTLYQLNESIYDLKQEIYETGSVDFATLQSLLDGFSEYQQIFQYLLKINQKSEFDLKFSGSKQHFDLKI